jgi:hypothetical protein
VTPADALTEWGRRAVACPRFRWSPGMLAIVPPANDGATGYTVRIIEGSAPVNSARAFPNLADDATLGALLGLVREAWGGGVHCVPDTGWAIRGARNPETGETIGLGISGIDFECGALVAALEARALFDEDLKGAE